MRTSFDLKTIVFILNTWLSILNINFDKGNEKHSLKALITVK